MTFEEAYNTLKRRDDESAWRVFFLEASQQLLAYVARLLVSFRLEAGETGQDIVQEVLVSFLEQWPKLKKELGNVGSAVSYLKASSRNLLVDRYRHRQTAQSLLTFLSSRYTESFGNSAEVLRPILIEQVLKALQADCASLLRKYIAEDLTPAEIAEEQGLSAATVYARWYRCLHKARVSLRHNPNLIKELGAKNR